MSAIERFSIVKCSSFFRCFNALLSNSCDIGRHYSRQLVYVIFHSWSWGLKRRIKIVVSPMGNLILLKTKKLRLGHRNQDRKQKVHDLPDRMKRLILNLRWIRYELLFEFTWNNHTLLSHKHSVVAPFQRFFGLFFLPRHFVYRSHLFLTVFPRSVAWSLFSVSTEKYSSRFSSMKGHAASKWSSSYVPTYELSTHNIFALNTMLRLVRIIENKTVS